MLSIINPSTMAMNMSCCSYAPYCSHGQRQLQPQALPPPILGTGGNSASWSTSIPAQQPTQYRFDRPHQTPFFPSQTLSYLNNQDHYRTSTSAYATPQSSSWTNPSYPVISNDCANSTWLPSRGKDDLQAPGSSSFSHENSDYLPGLKYEPLDLRDASPSRATDFSTVSASSQASPAPPTTFMSYSGLRTTKDGSPFMISQPLPPEQLRPADHGSRRQSVTSYDSDGTPEYLKGRSRKGSEAIHCHICYKKFDRRSNFKSHWETHDKDRPRTMCKIDGCQKTFGRPAEMTRHVNSAHRQKSFPCASCGKEFTRHDILLRHCKDACPVLVKGKGSGRKRRSRTS